MGLCADVVAYGCAESWFISVHLTSQAASSSNAKLLTCLVDDSD